MATVSVSNAAELREALNSAERGDVLLLAGGNYGSLGLNGSSRPPADNTRSSGSCPSRHTHHRLGLLRDRR